MRPLFVPLSVMAAISVAPALAEGDADAARGLVAEHCVACHAVPGYAAAPEPPSVAAVPFLSIAEDPETYSPERLRSFLRQPHWPMGQLQLSARDIDNVLAFIDDLAAR